MPRQTEVCVFTIRNSWGFNGQPGQANHLQKQCWKPVVRNEDSETSDNEIVEW